MIKQIMNSALIITCCMFISPTYALDTSTDARAKRMAMVERCQGPDDWACFNAAYDEATFHSDVDVLRAMVAKGIDINTFFSPLSMYIVDRRAGFHFSPEFLIEMIRLGAKIPSSHHRDPLFVAVNSYNIAAVEILLSYGALYNVNGMEATDDLGLSALTNAVSIRWVDYFRPFNEDNLLEIVNMLITAGADVNQRDPRGMSPLRLAATHCLPKVVQLLLQSGAGQDQRDLNQTLQVMYRDRSKKYSEVPRFLFPKDLDQRIDDIINQLIAHGADVDFNNSYSGQEKRQYTEEKKQVMECAALNDTKLTAAQKNWFLGCIKNNKTPRGRFPGTMTDKTYRTLAQDLHPDRGGEECAPCMTCLNALRDSMK